MARDIHPTAVVDPEARLGESVKIGPYCIVGAGVTLGEEVELVSHVSIVGNTTVGDGTVVYPFAALGHPPQDLKYAGEPTTLEIGVANRIREHVTMHPGTIQGRGRTVVGDHNLFMAATHVAHDCQIGNHVIMANNATLGGHVTVGDHAYLGGLSAVHQFVRIGPTAMVGGLTGVEGDVIPYGLVMGDRATLAGLNLVGLRRRGVGPGDLRVMRNAFRQLFVDERGAFADRLLEVAEVYADQPRVMEIVAFIKDRGNREVIQPAAAKR
ncbi:MAG: acyl-ACP--UDP-N-acetylglucosamine O-acyltransferase [Geminicoccaceae bacterium]|nr:MAG: acyl-ACP--UDP-N-acetylglucosamine O-acyltransferase [Geminicoccaceae bacterium]